MRRESENLPAFDNPPVGEVALGAYFDAALKLQVVNLMQLWSRWRGRFPNVQEQPEVPPVQDELSSSSVPPAFTLQVVDATSSAPLPRSGL